MASKKVRDKKNGKTLCANEPSSEVWRDRLWIGGFLFFRLVHLIKEVSPIREFGFHSPFALHYKESI